MNKRIGIIIASFLILVSLFYIYNAGYLGVWIEGMGSIVNNTDKYSDEFGYTVEGEFSVDINLSDLESNIGKELYNDGINKIYVSFVDNTGSINSGGYRIGFRSIGTYSTKEATLVSGIQHITLGENSFTSNMSAKMSSNYKGENYQCTMLGMSGVNYKDGDDFSFYIFPNDAYKEKSTILDEHGEVNIIISELYMNKWIRR